MKNHFLADERLVSWREAYWLNEEVEDVYDEELLPVIKNESQENVVRIWPYKGLKSEIIPLKRSVPDTRPKV